MPSEFPGFPQAGLDFLRKLKRNNNRDWFQARKDVFETQVKAPMTALVDVFNGHLSKLAPEHCNAPAKAIYRIYRDTRFSNDKTPYKTHLGAIFPRQGMGKHSSAGFYFSVGADEVEVAGGLYMPEPEQLIAVRQHIAQNYKEFQKILKTKTLVSLMGELQGEQLSRPPKGFAADHPAIELLRYKRWIFYNTQSIELHTATSSRFLGELLSRTKALVPFVNFLNQPLTPIQRRKETMRELMDV